jgi:hypothetical protein
MRKRRTGALSLVLAGAALVAAGCGGSDNGGTVANKPAPVKPKPSKPAGGGTMMVNTGAELSIGAPAAGTVVTANRVPFDVAIRGMRVDCRFAGTPNKMGIGHYHVELDGSLINMFCGPRSAVSLQNVDPGRHTLQFIPAANQHEDDLKAEKKLSFTYRPTAALKPIVAEKAAGKPAITILSPKPGSTVHGSFDFAVKPRNFELSCALYGKKDIAGYGHWHANVDSTTKGMMGMATMLGMSCQRTFHVSLAGISPGKHTFYAILEDNQHAPTPKAQDSVTLNVR